MNRKIRTFVSLLRRGREFGYGLMASYILTASVGRFLPKGLTGRIVAWQQKCAKRVIDRFMSSLDWDRVTARCEDNSNAGGTVWFLWLQGEARMPKIPRLCLDSLRRHACGHPVVVLDADNYRDYVTVPDYVDRKFRQGIMSAAALSDCIRTHLLSQRGGLWMDATILALEDLKPYMFDSPFYSIKTPEEGDYVSRCRWAGFCIASPKHGRLVECFAYALDEYWKRWDSPVDYLLPDYLIDWLYDHDPRIRAVIDAVPYNNPEVHALRDAMGLRCDRAELDRLRGSGFLFKLSWHKFSDAQLETEGSTYMYLRNIVYHG